MPGSDAYGDSDDEALLWAATQHAESQAVDDFEPSPRPSKRARIDGPSDRTTSDLTISEEDLLGDDTILEATEVQEEQSPNKKQRLLHEPQIQANLERVILTQTQAVPPSQPWEIRGPVWRKPEPPSPLRPPARKIGAPQSNGIAGYMGRAQQEAMAAPPIPSKSLAQIIETSNKEVSRAE